MLTGQCGLQMNGPLSPCHSAVLSHGRPRPFKRSTPHLFLAVLSLLLTASASAFDTGSSWFAHAWRTDDGLPDNGVSGIAQTPDGFLWIGTQGGLVRFDGAQFEEFSPDKITGVPNHVVRAMTADRRGRIWLGMDRGVVVCVGPSGARLIAGDQVPADGVKMMAEDGEGAMWILYSGTDQALLRVDDSGMKRFGPAEGLPNRGMCWITVDAAGRLWFAKSNKVGAFRHGRFETLVTLDEDFSRIAASHSGGIWIATETRLLRFQEGSPVKERARMPQREIGPGILLEDRSGALWIGASSAYGLFRYDGSEFKAVKTSQPTISCLFEDREGNLWVGTSGGGLNRLRPQIMELQDAVSGRTAESLRSICEDRSGAIWAVSRDGLVTRQEGSNWVNVTTAPNWPGSRALCIASDPQGSVWIGTRSSGIYQFQNGQYTVWDARQGLGSSHLRTFLISSTGDLWIGTELPQRLQRLHAGRFSDFPVPLEARSIRAMAEDAHGTVWTATAGGQLIGVHGDQVMNVTTNDIGHPVSIRSLAATPDGSLWIGYAGYGLARYKDGRYRRITMAQGLEEDSTSQIVLDGQGWMWLGGNHGFSRVQVQQLIDVVEGRAKRVRSIVFGRGEGLQGLQATFENCPATFVGTDGLVRIATRTGLLIIHTENIRDNPDPPPVLLERLAVDGQTVGLYDSESPFRGTNAPAAADLRSPTNGVRLWPGHRRVDFDFTALSLTAPENVEFRYWLEGFDEHWSEAGTGRSASYSRLPAGKYRFHVIASNNSGVWNEEGTTLAFIVLPFIWQRWWFQLAVLAAFTASLIAIVRYVSFRRLRFRLRTLEQQAQLDKERARIARDLHDDLGGSLTQVALSLDLEESDVPERIRQHLRQCSSMVRQVVASVDGIIWAINPRNDTLRYLIDYISQFAVEFLQAAHVPCRVEMPDQFPERSISPEVRHHLFLVVKEALNNIVCHAAATEVWLRVSGGDHQINIVIEDNGRGFDPAHQSPHGHGLRNMRQRMAEIGGECTMQSQPGKGTRTEFRYVWPAE
jgi:signal transduction histidine kinase/ligand-binding sensor domain-containing protein